MLYLCEISTSLPGDVAADVRQTLLEREWERGRALRALGKIAAIWRIEGQLANVSVWQVESRQELQELLASLPLARYQSISIRSLANHPVMSDDPPAGPTPPKAQPGRA